VAKAARDNFCAATLSDLATSCREAALHGEFDTVQGLALHSLFLGLGQRISHGPTSQSVVQAMRVQWLPILNMVIEHQGSEPMAGLNTVLSDRRHLVR